MDQVGIGFIGAGDVARIHAAALKHIPRARLVAVFDLDEGRSTRLASEANAEVCRSADDVVSHPSIDAVYVLTPQPAHHEHAVRSLRAGKHTFVEKPVSFSREHIIELINLSKQGSLQCVPGHNYIHSPGLKSAGEMIRSRQLGDVHSLWILFTLCLPENIRKRIPGPLREVMIHHFYSVLYLLGKPLSVQAVVSDFSGRGTTESDQAIVTCKMPSGALTTLFASFSVDDLTCDPWTVKYKILGTQGSISHTWSQSRLKERPQPIWDLPAYWETFREENKYFIEEVILKGKEPLSSMGDALTCLEILLAAEESVRTEHVQKLHVE